MKFNFSDLITFSRGSQASFFNSLGQMSIAPAGEARFDHDPVTFAPRGILIEEQRTNLILNSAAPVTQNVTVTAVAHTVSFYGNGTVTLSGAHAATVTGTGAFPTRTNLTFTPTAGTLTVTIAGDVQYMNLGAGAFMTSWIPTTTAAATRLADSVVITGTNLASFYNQNEGTVYTESFAVNGNANATVSCFGSGTYNSAAGNHITNRHSGAIGSSRLNVTNGAVGQADQSFTVAGELRKLALAYKVNDFGFCVNGQAPVTDTSGTVPLNITHLLLGGAVFSPAGALNGYIRMIRYFPRRLTNTELQAMTL